MRLDEAGRRAHRSMVMRSPCAQSRGVYVIRPRMHLAAYGELVPGGEWRSRGLVAVAVVVVIVVEMLSRECFPIATLFAVT